MKKTILFAMFAAGMMASCSQDSNNVLQPVEGNQDGRYPIMLGIGSDPVISVSSRGTGTVGGEDLATNLWAEQPLFIYSFDKTDAELATPIITNEEAIAPKGAVSGPITWKKATTQYFYEGTTTYDFYGYHIDDAVATVGGVPAQDA
ncbi:MAG: fimbrillin family protein, partial [Bacteroidaceae bacterium]